MKQTQPGVFHAPQYGLTRRPNQPRIRVRVVFKKPYFTENNLVELARLLKEAKV